MRFSLCIYWIAFLVPLIVSVASTKEDSQADDEIITDLESLEVEILALIQEESTWLNDESGRSKRNEEIVNESTVARRKKHRKRHRCKNQLACLWGSSTTPPGVNEPIDETSEKSKLGDGDEYLDEDPSAKYSAGSDQYAIPDSIIVLLNRLVEALGNSSNETLSNSTSANETLFEDRCQRWINSKDKFNDVFASGLTVLPACPCLYPNNIVYDDKVWDENKKKYYRWRDVSGETYRIDVYKPGASYCIRSALTQGTGSAAAQHCCYDADRKLLTRGSGAGTPHFISAEVSPILHEKLDVLPWKLCKGDFSRYNAMRPPNNENNCETNPDDEEYQLQINRTKYY